MRVHEDPGGWLVGIVGAGTMGAGIAQVAIEAGHEVTIYDVDESATQRGRDRVRHGLGRRASRMGLEGEAAAEWVEGRLGRLHVINSLDGLAAEADLVIEAALEDLELKQTVFRRLDASAAPDASLATNTSALSVETIAQATAHPERVLGLHFFNPAPIMKLVEVVSGPETDHEVAAAAAGAVTRWGKTPVFSSDAPGFIVNRVNRPFTLEALRIADAHEATIEQVDGAMVGAGFPMGPFALMDLVGIEVNLAAAGSLYQRFGREPRFEPSPTQERLVEAGRLGRKIGEGFYRYAPDGDTVGTSEEFAGDPAHRQLADGAIVERIVLGIVNEGYHALGEKVADRGDIDLALRLGAGHPRGPFEQADALGGPEAVRAALERLASELGPRFAPARLLQSAQDDAGGYHP